MDQNSRKWAFNDLEVMFLISNQQCPKMALRALFHNEAIIQTEYKPDALTICIY